MRRQNQVIKTLKSWGMGIIMAVMVVSGGVFGGFGWGSFDREARAAELVAEPKLGEIVVTGVNVGKNTVKLRYMPRGEEGRAEKVREIIMFVSRERFGVGREKDVFCGQSEITTKIFFQDCEAAESEWQKRLMAGEEVEIAGRPGFLQGNYRGMIYYNVVFGKGEVRAEQKSNARYLQCLQWPEYAAGQECRREITMTKAGAKAIYRPYLNGKVVGADEEERAKWDGQGEWVGNKWGRLKVTKFMAHHSLNARYEGEGIVKDVKIFGSKGDRKVVWDETQRRMIYWHKVNGQDLKNLNNGNEQSFKYWGDDLRVSPEGIVYIEIEIEKMGELQKNLTMVNVGRCVGVEDYMAEGGTEECVRVEREVLGKGAQVEYWRRFNEDDKRMRIAGLSELRWFEQEEIRLKEQKDYEKQEAARLKAERERKVREEAAAQAAEMKNLRKVVEEQQAAITKLMQEMSAEKQARAELMRLKAEWTGKIAKLEKEVREGERKAMEKMMAVRMEVESTRLRAELGQRIGVELGRMHKELMDGVTKNRLNISKFGEELVKQEGAERENIPVPITGGEGDGQKSEARKRSWMVWVMGGAIVIIMVMMAGVGVAAVVARRRKRKE